MAVSSAAYERKKDRERERNAANSTSSRDIAPLPEVVNPLRKAACRLDFRLYCETYHAATFVLAWSEDHLKVIGQIQESVLRGGLFATAMPRASGKTSLAEVACEWAMLYGHRDFVALIASDERAAGLMIESIKTELEVNDLLLEDFPEVCEPIRRLEGIAHRCNGQLFHGERTQIGWSANELVLPTIPGSVASGAVCKVCGITGGLRGMKFKRADGRSARPSLVIVDDPQTDEALDIATLIPTPKGFVPMGEIKVGDRVFDEQGKVCFVVATSPVMHGRTCYRVVFDDRSSVIADSGHKWLTSTALQRTNQRRKVADPDPAWSRRPQCQPQPHASVVTTDEIAGSLLGEGGRANHSIPLAGPIEGAYQVLPVPPYTLGVWLGDGSKASARITTADAEILSEIESEGFVVGKAVAKIHAGSGQVSQASAYTIHGLNRQLRAAGLLGNKHLPEAYRFATKTVRLAVLQGLMDTDGSISLPRKGVKGGRCVFANTNPELIEAVAYLCRSLGIKAYVAPHPERYPGARPAWRVEFITDKPVFRMSRKRERLPLETRPDTSRRYVVAVEEVPSRPVRCIEVDSPNHLYLCGRELIPTHNSARSQSQCETRERILAGAILGLAGPGKKIAGIMPCTVIRGGDMADAILDRDKHPEWNGTRTKMVYAFPANEKLWEEYGRIRADSLRAGNGGAEATEFYRAHRTEMDAGSRVAWPERFEHDEVSAIQHAMNLRLRDERAFFSEYQNEPLPEAEARSDDLSADQIASKINRMPRGQVPNSVNRLTGFIDVQGSLLYWLVCGWTDDFSGFVLDYGAFPDQNRQYYTLRDAKIRLADKVTAAGLEGQIYGGLEALCANILARDWPRDDGTASKVERCLIDANWGTSTSTVKLFCRQSAFSPILTPSHGKYIGAGSYPMSEWQKRPGERSGHNWRLRGDSEQRGVRSVVFDTNFWKSFTFSRLATAMGDRGGLSLFGEKAATHQLLADHLTSEFRVRTEGRGRTVDEWKQKPERFDNHWLDCLVGCFVGASMQGVSLAQSGPFASPAKRARVSFADKQRQRLQARG